MILKRLLATALGALGLGALAAGPAFGQAPGSSNIPAPDIFDDQITCTQLLPNRGWGLICRARCRMNAERSPLDEIVGMGDQPAHRGWHSRHRRHGRRETRGPRLRGSGRQHELRQPARWAPTLVAPGPGVMNIGTHERSERAATPMASFLDAGDTLVWGSHTEGRGRRLLETCWAKYTAVYGDPDRARPAAR